MTAKEQSVGEALIGLLEAYGVDTIFGIPGVHNVEMYRAMPRSGITHVLPRHEQGAGFMADGYARATGKPGVCFIISGPGLCNILTPIGQAYSDSVPMLVMAACLDIKDAAQGRGRLHEMRDQRGAAASATQWARTAYTGDDVAQLIAEAFADFSSKRPRPCYIEVPIDVALSPSVAEWRVQALPGPAMPTSTAIAEAINLLQDAKTPLIVIGGGACKAGRAVEEIAEKTGAMIITTIAGKGVVKHDHDLHLGAGLAQPAVAELVASADVILAAGTELAEPEFWDQPFQPQGKVIRIDIDAANLARPHPTDIAINSDAAMALAAIAHGIAGASGDAGAARMKVQQIRKTMTENDSQLWTSLREVLWAIRKALPVETIITSDMTQIAYAGNEIFPTDIPATWLHPTGFGTLGYALPAAIGAKVGVGEGPVIAIAGDYGFQYTLNELATAAELGQSLPVLVWNNNLLAQIHEDMVMKGIQPNAVNQKNPDFQALARAFGCHAQKPSNLTDLSVAIVNALNTDRPTVIEITPDIVKP